MPIRKPDYQLDAEYQQLALDLELPEVESDSISVEEARLRSESARTAFEGKTGFAWAEEYLSLRAGGWPWRQAAYIAWAASPKPSRSPKTQDALAQEVLGLTSDRAINTWRRKNPMIDETVAMLQAAPLFAARAAIYQALITNATNPNYKTHNDRKLALELMGDYVPASKLTAELTKKLGSDDLENMSEEELRVLAKAVKGADK